MATRPLTSRVDRFAGLSDRAVPVQLSRIESPDLLNAEFSDRAFQKRLGFTRLTEQLKDSSLCLDGYNDFVRIPDVAPTYQGAALGFSIVVKLREFPVDTKTIISKGFGGSTNRAFELVYDPSLNSNLGGWTLTIYDSGSAALRTNSIFDGDAQQSQVGAFRHIRVYPTTTGGTIYNFKIVEEDGTEVGANVDFTVTTLQTSTDDIFLGVDTTDGDTVPAEGDSSYAPVQLAEFRLISQATIDDDGRAALDVVDRELYSTPAGSSEVSELTGYWKLNDGNGNTVLDSISSNDGIAGANGAQWVTGAPATGPSALRFLGEQGHVEVDATDLTDHLFTSTFTGFRRWTLGFIYTPELGQGETTVRDQTLVWFGEDQSGTDDPNPLGVQVITDTLIVKYQDGTSVKTTTGPVDSSSTALLLSNFAGTRLRVLISCGFGGGGNENINIFVGTDEAVPQFFSASVTTANNDPASINLADDLSIGRRLQQFANPKAFQSKSGFGVIDDFHIHKEYTPASGLGPDFGSIPLFGQNSVLDTLPLQPNATLVYGLSMDDGQGNVLAARGTRRVSDTAFLFPGEGDGLSWCEGLVTPDIPPEITLLRDYRRLGPQGAVIQRLLAISGTGLYVIDPSDGTILATYGGLVKGGKWASKRYADRVYLACKNGRRPVVFDGEKVTDVGIAAPTSPITQISLKSTGGSFVDGTHVIYCTFRNSSSGAESNPSPSASLTFAFGGSVQAINSINIPRSSDPQVNQRRIWLTAVGAGAGTQATLVATIDDNTTTSYTTDITTRPATPTLEYVDNEEAPVASVLTVFRDRLLVAGNPRFPTRVYYSQPGELEAFNQTTGFEDADQDTGDPVVGLFSLRDQVLAYLRDGRVGYTPTGDVTVPFIRTDINRDTGAVSHHGIFIFENRHFFLGEQDLYLWDGDETFNLSSPGEVTRPSIKNYIRETLNDSRKDNVSMAIFRKRDQVWLSVPVGTSTTARNSEVIVFDVSQGVFSRYEMDLDIVSEIEDENDEPLLYGGIRGHVVQLDTGDTDGPFTEGTIASGSNTQFTDTGAGWTVDLYKGQRVFIRDITGNRVTSGLVERNTSDTVFFTEDLAFNTASGMSYSIGGIPWYADFILDFGDPMNLYRLRWIKVAGHNPEGSETPTFQVYVQENEKKRVWTWNPTEHTESWPSTTDILDFNSGCLGRTFRIKLTDSFFEDSSTEGFPQDNDRITIEEFKVEVEELSAR